VSDLKKNEGHSHHHNHSVLPEEPELRVKAIETLLIQKGLIDPDTLNELIDTYENKIGPKNGARVIAKAWVDDSYKERLLKNSTKAIEELSYTGRQGEHMVVVENTPETHNMVVCTLCSCYPWPVLGLPPSWYKSDEYRARAVREPRKVLKEFGLSLNDNIKIKVWDSTSEMRYLVLPMRPDGTEGFSEDELAKIVTRNSMIGTGLPELKDD
tara:strand:- start:2322 stop:2957 length:636 start_codon:yes stop_codon:yes gene_type:complete